MKKVFWLVFLCTINSLNAQYYSKSHFGFKAGVNYSRFMPYELMKAYEDFGYVRKVGFYAGALFNFELTENVKIQPELLFALQGSGFKNENIELYDSDGFLITRGDYKSNINEPTVVVPILIQFYANDALYFEGGPQFTYIINTSEKIKEMPAEEFGDGSQNSVFNNFDKFDFGASIGLGYRFSDNLILNGRYFFSLINRNENIKSSIFNLGIEYLF